MAGPFAKGEDARMRHSHRQTGSNMIADGHTHSTRCQWDVTQKRWICNADQQSAEPGRPLVDVRDMVVVHTALLREYRLAPSAVRAVADGDVARARRVTKHLAFLHDVLHHHHTGEDTLLWPRLHQRAPAGAAPLLELMQAQHAAIYETLTRVQAALPAWTEAPNAAVRDRLADDLTELHAHLVEHLGLEERDVLPLAAANLTESEWHEIGEAAVAATPKTKLPLVFGMFSYEGDPAVLRAMLRSAPAVPRLILPRLAPRLYARHAARLYGTPAP